MPLILFYLFLFLPFTYISIYGYKYGINIFGDLLPNLVMGLQGIIIITSVILAFFIFNKFYKLRARQKNVMTWLLFITFGAIVIVFSQPFAPIQDSENTIQSVNVCYYISDKEVMSIPGTSSDDLTKRIGPPTERLYNGIVFDYLTTVSDDGCVRGAGFYVDTEGKITDIMPLATSTKTSNWFQHLPFYTPLASTNLFNFCYLGNTSTEWYEVIIGPLILMLFFCFAIYFALSAFKFHELLSISKGKTPNPIIEKVVFLLTGIVVYAALIPFLNVTHSFWYITILLYFFCIYKAISTSLSGAASALNICPSCHQPDMYFPKRTNLRTEVKAYRLNGPKYPLRSHTAVLNWIATKDYTKKVWYKKEGACKNCGYEDTTEYWEETDESTQKCPHCESDLLVTRDNISIGTGGSRDKYLDNATIDLTQSERKGYDTYEGPVTVSKQTITSKYTTFDYSEKCPHCSYKFGPKKFTILYEDSNTRTVTENKTVKVDN